MLIQKEKLNVINMEKKISPKTKKNLEKIIELKSLLKNWESYKEEDLFLIIKEFEKKPRDEGSFWYDEVFCDDELSKILLSIADKYRNNSKINTLIVSTLGNLILRYKLTETKEIYDYFYENRNNSSFGAYVALYITKFNHFKNETDKWHYIMKIIDLKPKKIAESEYSRILEKEKENLPTEYKKTAYFFFKEKAEKANNEGGKKYYLEIVKEFE